MPPLTDNKAPTSRAGTSYADPVAANTRIFRGALTQLDNAGNAVPATASGNPARGVACAEANNTGGAAGDITVPTDKGVFRFAHTGLDRTDIGTVVSVTDDQTVGRSGTATAGTLVDIDAQGAWVRID